MRVGGGDHAGRQLERRDESVQGGNRLKSFDSGQVALQGKCWRGFPANSQPAFPGERHAKAPIAPLAGTRAASSKMENPLAPFSLDGLDGVDGADGAPLYLLRVTCN